jgi:hypothetical protein
MLLAPCPGPRYRLLGRCCCRYRWWSSAAGMSVNCVETRVASRGAHFDNLLLRLLRRRFEASAVIDVDVVGDVCHVRVHF